MTHKKTPPGTDDAAELQALRERVTALETELQRMKDIAGRAQADLQNAKQRMDREAADLRAFAAVEVVRRILPTLDNFQRAFQSVPEELKGQEWVKGVTVIEQDLLRQMTEMGLKRMSSLGQIVDPAIHDVVTVGPGEEGKVVEVFDEGYTLNDRILRPAKVKAGGGLS
jgi:molecular chaperone GrpE (heat shock protein)